ncbi:MAG: hypothetical protein K0V04_04705, partial [Deltaproteobacteria bacterium]|nr:hypothetical protein [Deltaproteobacteria bacterium]
TRRMEAATRSAARDTAIAPPSRSDVLDARRAHLPELRTLRAALWRELNAETPNASTMARIHARMYELDPRMSLHLRSVVARTMALVR